MPSSGLRLGPQFSSMWSLTFQQASPRWFSWWGQASKRDAHSLLRPKLLFDTLSVLPHSTAQNDLEGQPRFSGWGNRCHLVGRAAKSRARLRWGKNRDYFHKYSTTRTLKLVPVSLWLPHSRFQGTSKSKENGVGGPGFLFGVVVGQPSTLYLGEIN